MSKTGNNKHDFYLDEDWDFSAKAIEEDTRTNPAYFCSLETHLKTDDNRYQNYEGSEAESYKAGYEDGFRAAYIKSSKSFLRLLDKYCDKGWINVKEHGDDIKFGGF